MKPLLLFFTLLFTALAGAQVITIPDAAFENLLVTAATYNQIASDGSDYIAVDANGDGAITQAEAEEVRELYLNNQGIASLQGIEYFTNLRVLYVSDNSIAELDITPLEDLEYLYINNNQLTSLTILDAHDLKGLDCSNNQLTVLDFGSMEYLESANCSGNNLTQLDVSGCINLSLVSFANNNITYVNIKNGMGHTAVAADNQWQGNPGLAYMCIDDQEAAAISALLAANGYTTVVANSFCSFTPGGDYNTIKGTLTFDVNGDGCDVADSSQKFMKVTTEVGAEACAVFTDANGEYELYTLAGTFAVAPQFEENYFEASYVAPVAFPYVNNAEATANFCITPNTAASDIEIVMMPVVAPVPGQDVYYKMVYKNKGNQVLSGSVQCTWNYTKFDFYANSFMPDANQTLLNGNLATYVWDYTNLEPFESREIKIRLAVHSPTDAIPVNVGDALSFDAQAILTADAIQSDNTSVLEQQAVATATTASITCIEGAVAPVTQIGEYLHYVVNFTNEGTETPDSVVIETEVDPEHFDINTLQVLNSSHNARVQVQGNTARFMMPAFMQAADGHGNILFKAKTKNNLASGATVLSSARIYFGYTAPVETNVAETQLGVMGMDDVAVDASVTLYPNPAKDVVNINAANNLQQVNLYDVQGRLLQTEILNNTQTTIDLSSRAAGIYFVKAYTQAGVKVQKVVKE
ncbi:T9SS type A sorting domain-containing protein [Flavobacterium akiainvivens]|nr:T9SS type A sorting domain-containing protein [Flavobacterium akiainvivens]